MLDELLTQEGYCKTLLGYRNQALRALLRAVPKRGPPYLYELTRAYPMRGGKGLRAALCMATCRAFGGTIRQSLNSAVAVELFHNAFLVYDDVQDASRFRRGAPTLHASHGTAIAVNVGNATNLLALRKLMDNRETLGSQASWLIMQEAERMLSRSLEGQAVELAWIHDNACNLTERDYLAMCLNKTSWYSFIHPMRVGAIAATGEAIPPQYLCRFGWYLGAAFQIQDDLLNLLGKFRAYGKEIDGDLVEGKRTLMLIHLLQRCSRRERGQVRRILAAHPAARTRSMIRCLRDLFKDYGSLEHTRRCARQLAGAALFEGISAFRDAPKSKHKDFILATPAFVVGRDH